MTDSLVFNVFFLIWSSTGGTQAVHISLDVIIAELADLVRLRCLSKMFSARKNHFNKHGEGFT